MKKILILGVVAVLLSFGLVLASCMDTGCASYSGYCTQDDAKCVNSDCATRTKGVSEYCDC